MNDLSGLLSGKGITISIIAIGSWCRGTRKLVKNRNKILQALSEIFSVDVKYLTCEQIERHFEEKRKSFPNANDETIKQVEELENINGIMHSTEFLGFKSSEIYENGNSFTVEKDVALEYLGDDSCEITIAESAVPTDTNVKYQIVHNDKVFQLSYEEAKKIFVDNMKDFLKFELYKLEEAQSGKEVKK